MDGNPSGRERLSGEFGATSALVPHSEVNMSSRVSTRPLAATASALLLSAAGPWPGPADAQTPPSSGYERAAKPDPAKPEPAKPNPAARQQPATSLAKLQLVATFDHQVTGVAVAKDGRIFVTFPR